MQFRFPNLDGQQVDMPIGAGQVVFVVGANGSGKSSLIHKLYVANKDHAIRISAHRQSWFQSNAVDMTPASKKQTGESMVAHDTQPEGRWMDRHANRRASMAIYNLIYSENARARKIADKVTTGKFKKAKKLARKEAPLRVLNDLLETANLNIEISIKKQEQIFASKNGSVPYSIAELSDGERAAVILGASVLTADPDTLIIIDEPEQHLHRSIASPLLLSLFDQRDDCVFVISTHDVSLPMDSPDASVLLIRSCSWETNTATGWDTDLLSAAAGVTDEIRRAILGSRRKILFVEGGGDSLDCHIYSILYPSVSVMPRGNCIGVERAVIGIRTSEDVVWASAFGLIDRDDRPDPEVEALAKRFIFALQCYSVESLYYCEPIMEKIAKRQAKVSADLADLDAAKESTINCVAGHRDRLCMRMIEKQARTAVTSPDYA